MISLLKFLDVPWERARTYLRLDLEAIQSAVNQRWAATFGDKNILPPSAGGIGLTPPFAVGDILFTDTTTTIARLADVALGSVLISGGVGVKPLWSSTPTISTLTVSTFTSGSVVFTGAGGLLKQDNAKLFWDDTNFRLGIGTATPGTPLDVNGIIRGTNLTVVASPVKFLVGITLFLYLDNASNLGVGSTALSALTSGTGNTAIGTGAGSALTSGKNNTLVGFNAGSLITTTDFSTIMGYQAGAVNTATQACFFGYQAGQSNTTGTNNAYFGVDAGQSSVTGSNNTAVGQQALQSGTSNSNTAVGTFAGISITTADNVMVGFRAGIPTNPNASTTGQQNTFIGSQTGENSASQHSNSTALGYNALISASNQIVLGNASVTLVTTSASISVAGYTHSAAEIDKTYTIVVPVTGDTKTMAAGQSRIIFNPAGTLALLTVTLPPTPVDGQIAGMSFTQIITGLTINAPGGATVVAPPTSAAVDSNFRFLYQASSTSWFPAP